MRKMFVLIVLGAIIMISYGCQPVDSKMQSNKTGATNTITKTLTPERITPSPTRTPPQAFPTSTITAISPTQTTVSGTTLHFDQGQEPLDFTSDEFSSCIGSEELGGLDVSSGQGMATYNRTDKALQIWGKQGFRQPMYSVTKSSPALFFVSVDPIVSPDHEWLYYLYRPKLDDFDVYVVNPKTGEKIQRHFEGVTLAWTQYWAGTSHLVFPLQPENNVYNWMAWDPFTDEVEIVSARLPGIGTAYENTGIIPVYDPRSEQVVYPCDACGEEDFRSYHVPSQSVVWAVDFGKGPFANPRVQPTWSEDGETVVFYFGLNKLWVVSRDGKSLLKAILPFGDTGDWVVSTLSWSPDGKRLAMIRDTKDPTSPILSILSIEEGKLINLCARIDYGYLGWSYDSRHIFYIRDRPVDDTNPKSVIAILDTTTGEGWQDVIPEDIDFVGWIKP